MARLHGSLKIEEVLENGRTKMREGRTVWRLLEPLEWRFDDIDAPRGLFVPKGFETDLASVPAAFRALIPASGPWQRAAVIHDYLYSRRGDVNVFQIEKETILHSFDFLFSRRESDDIFRQAMKAAEVNFTTRMAIYFAVRTFGGKGWGA